MAFDVQLASKPNLDCDDAEWAARSEHWLSETRAAAPRRAIRQRAKEPLILSGHGVSLRIDNRALIVRDGFTHYPQKDEARRFFRGDITLPSRIVMLDGSGTLSFDVLAWLAEQSVALICINWKGEVLSAVGGYGYAADRAKVKWQAETRAEARRRLAFSVDLIARKITGSIDTLETVIPQSPGRDAAVGKLHTDLAALLNGVAGDPAALRGIEGRASASYFGAWQGASLQWKTAARHPFPQSWRKIGPRSSVRAGKARNARASHPVNAMLNYAYAMLQSGLQIQAVAEGYDPTLGIMHHGHNGKPAYIFDLMEPMRPVVDAAVLGFALATTFSGGDFTLREDGVCRLSPQLAKHLCAVSARQVTAGPVTQTERAPGVAANQAPFGIESD